MKETSGPFLTDNFSMRGGGIDFLGLRYVSLRMVGENLIPELNNVTRDVGTFFLGTWLPWKFERITNQQTYTEENFQQIQERMEVALGLAMHEPHEVTKDYGTTRNRVGVTQKITLPTQLTFKNAGRTKQNSLYAPAIYGPSLRALHLVKSYSVYGEKQKHLRITTACDDSGTDVIAQTVDRALKATSSYDRFIGLPPSNFTTSDIKELAEHGLDPSVFRSEEFADAWLCFQEKLLPDNPNDPGYGRTTTTRLVLCLLRQQEGLTSKQIRNSLYTGLLPTGEPVRIIDQELVTYRDYWALFMLRQYQRHPLETFLWCFEMALKDGCRSIDAILEYWLDRSPEVTLACETFGDIIKSTAGSCWSGDFKGCAEKWSKSVGGEHDDFEYVEDVKGDAAAQHCLRMLSGWFLRATTFVHQKGFETQIEMGGSDRMSIGWFYRWLDGRKQLPLRTFLKDIFSDLIFSQHIRVALSRFDGQAQRLRFLLADEGIAPTLSTKDLAKRDIPYMPDRLDTLIELLSDIQVLQIGKEGKLYLGKRADSMSQSE